MSTYRDALDYIEYHLTEADKVGATPEVCFAPIDGVYEILGTFFEGDNGDIIGLENEYVTEEVAFRIANEFGVPIMIVADSVEELDEIYGVPT